MSDTLAIMPTFIRSQDDLDVTHIAMKTLRETSDAELLVVDDGSPAETDLMDQLGSLCREWATDYIPKEENEGFATTVNWGLRQARGAGQNALLVNADMHFMNNDWLNEMRETDGDVVGALLLYPNGLVQHAGIYFSVINRIFDNIYRLAPHTLDLVQRPRICPVTGALMFIRNETLVNVGMYDENFKMGFEDVDYCHEVFKSGRKCVYNPSVVAIHHESLFRRNNPSDKLIRWSEQSWHYLHQKHKGHSFAEYVPTMLEPEDF